MTIGSLFSGYGGLDLAVQKVFGGEVAWHCEWDKAPSAILEHHWPGVPNLHDVTQVDWATVPPVDILTGGYPCQPFSAAGQRKGTDDDRHLWPYVREAIRVLRPRFTVLENVAGHRSLGFDRVLADLAEDGMHVRWASVRASDVGAPHHRERLFILVTFPDTESIRRDHGQAENFGPSDRKIHASRNDRDLTTDTDSIRCVGRRDASEQTGGPHPATDRLHPLDWGPYDAAVRRWERLTRPAPAPTEPNRNSRPRLSATFAEWMMGLPADWVTDPAIGLTRSEQLKAVGNGVCPQQATAAIRAVLAAQASA
ncbi:DNA cytosine methyltransferase [Rhodococcus marinonascens]|uniref:DNA cytosine methyltransferase n=1 Tax=Rhodococcus marinonascens TaxID=38311 RepID=UPI0009353B83